MKKIKLTTAQALVKFLDNQYIEFEKKESKYITGIISIFGHGNVVGLGEALAHTNHNLNFFQAYNEQSMGHIAIGYAKQNKVKKIYAITSSVGPGSANMVTAAATATANRIPTLFLLGDVYADRQPDPVLQQIEHPSSHSLSTNDAFKPVSVYWDRIDRPEKLMAAMLKAMLALTNVANMGAVTIALPQDVQGETYEYPASFFAKRVYKIDQPSPSNENFEIIVNAIKNSKQPLIICGGGVIYSEAEKELEQFATKFQIPIAETQAGKSALLYDYDLNLGGIGTTGFLSANKYAKNADLIIGLGTRYTDFTTASKTLFNENAKFININLSRFDASKMDGVMIIADIKKTLLELTKTKPLIPKKGLKFLISALKKAARKEIRRLHNLEVKNLDNFIPEVNDLEAKRQIKAFSEETKSTFTQTTALGIINNNIAKDAIVVAASGSLPGDLQRIWMPKKANTYHVEYGYSCMGYEVAAALGAKLARPRKEVYALVGDGAYMMLHTALLTSLQENYKINVLLFNNSSYGCINNLQVGKGINSLGTEFKIKNSNKIMHVNYAQQAAGYGAKTYRVKNKEELLLALSDAKQIVKSTLIEILVLPKTMTHDYDSWWRVGNAKISKNDRVTSETKKDLLIINKTKGY